MSLARVLCVDDNATYLKSLLMILERSGFDVVTARNGAEALVQMHGDSKEFDAIVTDNEMEVMGGLEFVRTVRNKGFQGKILVMSGNFSASDRKDYEPYDVTGFFNKPLEIKSLVKTLVSLVPAGSTIES